MLVASALRSATSMPAAVVTALYVYPVKACAGLAVERAAVVERARPGDVVSFADGYPILLVSEASLADLNGRLAAPIAMTRFRPNIVVAGCASFAEDGWARLRIGEIGFRGVKPCDRCVVTTIDPTTGKGGVEPLRTLASFRRVY